MPKRKPGEVRDAIVSYLADRGSSATVAEIQRAVCNDLGAAVPPSSVRSYLRLNDDSAFTRVGRGSYVLAEVADTDLGWTPQEAPTSVSVGRAELVHTDCFAWLRDRERLSVHAVVTDPPYGLVEYSQSQQAKLRAGYGGVWRIPPSFDGHQRAPVPRFTTLTPKDIRELDAFFHLWARLLLPVLVPGAQVVVASNPLVSYVVAGAVVRAGFERRGEIVRLVMTMRGGDRPKNAHEAFPDVSVMPRAMWEPWLLFRKPPLGRVQDNLRQWQTGGFRRLSEDRPFGDVIQSHPAQPSERRLAPHPSLKPQAFLRQVVRAVLPIGKGVILDPFAGSGSTLAAAEAVGYQSIGLEKDAHFFTMAAAAIPRLAQLTTDAHRPPSKSSSREALPALLDLDSPSSFPARLEGSSDNPQPAAGRAESP